MFDHYAKYYNLLYQDKDYAGEAKYVLGLLADYGVTGGSMLELGSGTGKHALQFAETGFAVTGYDLSPAMVRLARRLKQETGANMDFRLGDLRNLDTAQQYDAVVSLFHVASYQTENADLLAMFKTAARCLKPAGVFLFDCWYGLGVLADPPVVRTKRLEDDSCRILRIAEPLMDPRRNVVDVNYTILISDKADGAQRVIEERHPMRYLFEPEVQLLLSMSGLRMVACLHWQSRNAASPSSWQCVFVVRPL